MAAQRFLSGPMGDWLFFFLIAAVGVVVDTCLAPPALTALGMLKWLALVPVVAVNSFGYVFMLVELVYASCDVYRSFRLFGMSGMRANARRTQLLYRFTERAQRFRSVTAASLFLVALLAAVGYYVGFQYVAGIQCLIPAVVLGELWARFRPPVVLFMAASNARTLALVTQLRFYLRPRVRIVALLDDKRAATDRDRRMGRDNFRTQDHALWRDVVIVLKDMVRVIVIDTDTATEGVLFEIKSVLGTKDMEKVLFLVSDTGRSAALEAALKLGFAQGDLLVPTVTLSALLSAIQQKILQPGQPFGLLEGIALTPLGEFGQRGRHHGLPSGKVPLAGPAAECGRSATEGAAMANSSDQPGFVKLDFARYFPHKFWISDWSEDDEYPEGFCYKFLGVRDEKMQVVELVLLLQKRDGGKQEMHRYQVKVAAADLYARVFVDGLKEELGLDFEEQDFTAVRTAEEFDRAVAAYGWSGKGSKGTC